MSKKTKELDASWDEVEKETVLIRELINRLPYEDRSEAAHRFCYEAALYGGFDIRDALGILEWTKHQLLKSWDKAGKDIEETKE